MPGPPWGVVYRVHVGSVATQGPPEFVDNGDGTWTAPVIDNGDGTWTSTQVTDNGDGTWTWTG